MIQVLKLYQTRSSAVMDCTFSTIEFPSCFERRVEAAFAGCEFLRVLRELGSDPNFCAVTKPR